MSRNGKYPLRKSFFICLIMALAFTTKAQEIPKERLANWSFAGADRSFNYKKTVDISDFGADNTSKSPSDEALKKAIEQLLPEGGIIHFGSGSFLFNKTINIPSNIIVAGKGAQNTVFIFKLKGKGHCISFVGKINSKAFVPTKTAQVGDTELAFNESLKKGDLLFIRQKEFTKASSSWAMNHFGQIAKVATIHGNTTKITEGLRYAISDLKRTDVRVILPVKNAGIEGVKIIRRDGSNSKVGNIYFKYASDCIVNGVESEKTIYAHVIVSHSAHITITGSYFHHSFSYGSGGKGYGALLHFSSSNCLVENNIFEHLRHSMLIQAGANGNVFAYNYSLDPYWDQSFFPSGTAGDIVLHGNYPYLNLFEGNIAQNLVIDGSHGKNGPNNTFFRNRLEYLGVTCIANPPSDNQNVIANEVTSTGFLTGLFILFGSDHYLQYNLVGSDVKGISKEPIENSLYLKEKPEYFEEDSWPIAGNKALYNQNINPAKKRYLTGNFTHYVPTLKWRSVKSTKKKKGLWYRLFHKD